MDKQEVQKIVNDEIKKFLSDKLDTEVAKLAKSRGAKTHGEIIDIVKDAMVVVHKYMWLQKDNWKNSIK